MTKAEAQKAYDEAKAEYAKASGDYDNNRAEVHRLQKEVDDNNKAMKSGSALPECLAQQAIHELSTAQVKLSKTKVAKESVWKAVVIAKKVLSAIKG